MNNRDIYTKVV